MFVFKVGTAAHINSFGLGETGRYRPNVWDYSGADVVGHGRDANLAMRPTVKPVAMIKNAIMDCSGRGDIVLDTFARSGSTLIPADACGRNARPMDINALSCFAGPLSSALRSTTTIYPNSSEIPAVEAMKSYSFFKMVTFSKM